MRASLRALVWASIVGFAVTASAQQPVTSMIGARVKFDLVTESTSGTGFSRYACEGTIADAAGNNILIAPYETCAINNSVQQEVSGLQIEAGNKGSRASHLLYGVLIGSVTGGIIGRLKAGDGCRVAGCDDAGFAIGVITTAGVAVGTVVGGVVGLILPAGDQWRAMPRMHAVLVAKRASAP